MISIILLGVFFGLLILRIPVAVSMGLAAISGILYMGMDISIISNVLCLLR